MEFPRAFLMGDGYEHDGCNQVSSAALADKIKHKADEGLGIVEVMDRGGKRTLVSGLTIVTRNIADFSGMQVTLLNP
jgi:hypothetical protein